MNQILWVLSVLAIVGLLGCSMIVENADGGGGGDADTDTDSDTDGDSDIDTSANILAPGAPIVTAPSQGARIVNPLVVEGTGEAGASVTAKLLNGGAPIDSASGTVDEDGNFRLTLDGFAPPAVGTNLGLEVFQANEHGDSPTTEVGLKYEPISISGTFTGAPEFGMGVRLFVRLYDSADEVIEHLQELTFNNLTGGAPADYSIPYSFEVGDGEYYVRAFVDRTGGCSRFFCDSNPDGHPSLFGAMSDPQTLPLGPFLVTPSTSGNLDAGVERVNPPMSTRVNVYQFDVYTYNESQRAEAPQRETWPGSGQWVNGEGLCRGYHMTLEADVGIMWGPNLDQDALQVVLPNGERRMLLNDGGCGYNVADNTAGSYDFWDFDSIHSLGWPEPRAEDAGTYTFYMYDEQTQLMHSQEDEIADIKKLTRGVRILEPSGDTVWGPNDLYLRWKSVPGVLGYEPSVDPLHNCCGPFIDYWNIMYDDGSDEYSYDYFGYLGWENTPFEIRMRMMDIDPNSMGNNDLEAMSESESHHFVVYDPASDPGGTMTPEAHVGAVINDSGESYMGVYLDIEAEMNYMGPFWMLNGSHSSQYVASGDPSFSLYYLNTTDLESLEINAFLDVDGSGDPASEVNQFYHARASSDPGGSSPDWPNIRFGPPVRILEPFNGQLDVPTQPTFKWETIETPPGGDWSYVLVTEGNKHDGPDTDSEGGGPGTVYSLPSTATSYTLGDSGAAFDVMNAYSGGSSPSVTELESNEYHMWILLVVGCKYPTNTTEEELLMGCLSPLFDNDGNGAYAESPEFVYMTE